MRDWFPMAVHLLEGLFFGIQNSQQVVGQRERLLALGSLSAGLTHELNNPAAAAVRATSSLRERVAGMRHKLALIAAGAYDAPDARDAHQPAGGRRRARGQGARPDADAGQRPRGRARRLVRRRMASPAAGTSRRPSSRPGWTTRWLDQVSRHRRRRRRSKARSAGSTTPLETELLMNEIEDSTTRISTLVAAAKQYSQMDRAPFQVVDVHELLDSTLLMLGRKLGDGIRVVKDYDHSLPTIPAFAAELNQVWTNLIDNAIGAMDGSGTLTVRTSRDGDFLLVEVGDTGPGMPEEIARTDLRAVLHHQAGR